MEKILSRIKDAIEIMNSGQPFRVGELYMGIDKNGDLGVQGISRSISERNIIKKSALLELEQIKFLFWKMASHSTELRDFINNKKIEFSLSFNYGMGSIRICSEMNGVLKWETDIRE